MNLNWHRRLLVLSLLIFFCCHLNASEHISSSSAVINISDYFKVLFGLIFVIGLFLACTFLFKRYGNSSITGRGQIRLVDGLHIGSRERLVLVELKDKQILLAITPGQINKLDTIITTVDNSDA